jgi:hypothetical protein
VLDDPAVDDPGHVDHREVQRPSARRPEERAGRGAPAAGGDDRASPVEKPSSNMRRNTWRAVVSDVVIGTPYIHPKELGRI